MSNLYQRTYNPDILDCLANLSSDEVFTPPDVANRMLDLLPQELFSDPNTTFLDPACKSGVFLREIAKRLITGLEHSIPDIGKRIEHIYHNQLFGIAITELTSLMSRRTLYYTKYPQTKFSIAEFDNPEGNIIYKNVEHTWDGDQCKYCGASRGGFDRNEGLEKHAYNFIHTEEPEEIFNMKFDVIIGNPPYQLDDGGSKASAKPIYQHFVEQAKKLLPRYLTMIVPARWYSGGKGLNSFRKSMLNDRRLTRLVDYFDSTEVFPGVDISGGVCYFLWDRDNPSDATITTVRDGVESSMLRPLLEQSMNAFIRFNEGVNIFRKVQSLKEGSFSELISSRKPFGLDTNVSLSSKKKSDDDVFVYAYPENGFISKDKVSKGTSMINEEKVFISYAYGERGSFPYLVLGKPFVGEIGTACSETYLLISANNNPLHVQK